MTQISRLLVISRGEIAVRTIRTATEMGITTIAAYSDADESSLAVALADESINIGGAQAKKSYLNHVAILEAARDTKADAIHPGYGFLSESADFAREVEEAGLVWVGPGGDTISRMGDKATAIKTAEAAGVPVVPGSGGVVSDVDAALAAAEHVGFPMMIKSTAGGGGRGIHVARDEDELRSGFASATREAQALFGDVRSTSTSATAPCNGAGRRSGRAPAAILTPAVREKMCAAAAALAESVQYSGAGTVEFLFDPATEEYFFIEMNTRIQVEHPITEEICGVDLIRGMLLVAQGEPLPYRQEDISIRGHAIEVRINSEDPDADFRPGPGTIETLRWPAGPGVRIDSMAFAGCTIPPYYDSLIGKLIVWAETRDLALARLGRALAETEVDGPATTLPFFGRLLQQEDVVANEFHTSWIETWLEEGLR